jgi:hypothetical protein
LIGSGQGAAGALGRRAECSETFVTEQDPQALAGDVVDHRLGHQEVRQLRQLQVLNASPCSDGFDFAVFLIFRRSDKVDFCGRPPESVGFKEANPSSLSTTQIYLTPVPDDVIASVLAFHERRARPAPPQQPGAGPGYRAETLRILFGDDI